MATKNELYIRFVSYLYTLAIDRGASLTQQSIYRPRRDPPISDFKTWELWKKGTVRGEQ